ncbi:hypothetical protein OPKNFCMD_5361 [Methylobacterium crusticola]|uniref:FXSXX-COOH protein n=1 Tax=Methylobacterium crusticola TaxID=1697972 RepID=A0ABQ4R605_9HYPH|nr:hypothetical protein [Methylobacterium crusticola]GJD52595.1 hypothetical protein OPKNFCMD_5361 [Methylobacterium crusticola]
MTSRSMTTNPFPATPALPGAPQAGSRNAAPSPGRLAAALSPGLHAVFDGCLSETLPSTLAASLSALVGRLDHEAATFRDPFQRP